MTASSVVRRRRARVDLELAADFYDQQGGQDLAFRFLGAVELAIRALAARPGLGSSRYGELLAAPGLRSRSVKRFPYLIF